MKQFLNKKWALSAFLIAALGSQYYFSVSSQQSGAYDMSLTAAETLTPSAVQSVEDVTTVLKVVEPPKEVVPKVGTTREELDKIKAKLETEGKSLVAECKDCVALTKLEAELTAKALKELKDLKENKTKVEDEYADETPSEKRRRLREDAKEEKTIKEQDKIEANNEKFEDAMDRAAEKCNGKIDCITSRYTSLLKSHKSKNSKIDSTTAKKSYADYIEPLLKAELAAEDNSEKSAEIIRKLAAGIPNEYRDVKQSMVITVKQSATERAASTKEKIKEQLTLANQATAEKNFIEANARKNEAQQEYQSFKTDVYATDGNTGYVNILDKELKNQDPSTWTYLQSNLIGPVKKLFSEFNNTDKLLSTVSDQAISRNSNNGIVRGGNPIVSQDNNLNNSAVIGIPTNTLRGTRPPRN